MPWTDSHCHVAYDGVGIDAVARAAAAGVSRVITIGTDVAASVAAIDVTRAGRDRGLAMWATVGLHPHEAVAAGAALPELEALLDAPEVVAVGECGLDYYYEHSRRDVQREAFAAQIEMAKTHDLALVVHTRDAWDDTFAVLDAAGAPVRTVIHCFSGGPDEARRCLERDAYLSFSGIVTFKNAGDVREAAALCPDDRLLVETDAPYLAPMPHRGKPNEPAWVALVGAAVADARGVSADTVATLTSTNAERVFAL